MKNRVIVKLLSGLIATIIGLSVIPLVSAETLSDDSKGTLTVHCGGKSYEFEYGETFYYTVRLQFDHEIEVIAGKTKFDPDKLSLEYTDSYTAYPQLRYAVHAVRDKEKMIYFNAADIDYNFNFRDEKTLLTYEFKVKGVGECDLEMNLTHLSDPMDSYINGAGDFTGEEITITELVSKEPYAVKYTIECDGKIYTFDVGDYFTYTVILYSEKPVNDFMGQFEYDFEVKGIEDTEKGTHPNILMDLDSTRFRSFSGIPRRGCDFTTPDIFVQYNLYIDKEGAYSIDTRISVINGHPIIEEYVFPWDYTLIQIITPYGEELPEITIPSTEDEEPATKDEEPATKDEEPPTNHETPKPIPPTYGYEYGDVNMDEKLSIKDATLIQKYLAKIIDLNTVTKGLADYNRDGHISIKDATNIQKKLANII